MIDIKFRAWDEENKKLVDIECLTWRDGELCADGLVVEQFIGINDDNGSPVYVGDIVDVAILCDGQCKDDDYDVYTVEQWKHGFYCVPLEAVGEPCDNVVPIAYIDSIIIVGNIHEDKKLLGGI